MLRKFLGLSRNTFFPITLAPKVHILGLAFACLSACSDNPTQQYSISSEASLNAPGINRLSRTIDVNSLQARIILTIDGIDEEIEVFPVNSKEGIWTASFLVPKNVPFSIENIWSAVGVDGHRVNYARLQKSLTGVDEDTFFDTTPDAYEVSAALFDNDNDGTSNFEELAAGTPAVLTPIAYYPLDNGQAQDLSGNNLSGTVIGVEAAVDENNNIDSAIRIGSSSERIVLPSMVADNLNDFTFVSKIQFDSFNTGRSQANVILSVATANQDNEIVIGYGKNETGVPIINQFYITISEEFGDTFTTPIDLMQNVWYCIAVYRDGTSAGLIVDGNIIGDEIAVPRRRIDADDPGVVIGQEQDALGGSFDSGQALAGAIDEIFFFDRVLSVQEIQTLCN